jgi:hypothetical protein
MTVFGRWFPFLVLMLPLAKLYNFSVPWSDNEKEIKKKELENDRVKKGMVPPERAGGEAGKKAKCVNYIRLSCYCVTAKG